MVQAKQRLLMATMLLCSLTKMSGEIILTQSDGLLNTTASNSVGIQQYVYTSPVFTLDEATNLLIFTFLEGYTTTASLNDTNGYPFIALAEFYLYDGDGNEVMLNESNFSTNAQEPTEGLMKNICDKNLTTFFHSMWSTGASDYHNITITLPDGISLKEFKFKYVTRYTQQCVPKKISIKTDNDVIAEGTCGEALTWGLTAGGSLIISGEGDMDDYYYDDAPWYEYQYQGMIKKVTINERVTSIGDYAFFLSVSPRSNLTSVDIAESVERIGKCAFCNCNNLTSVDLPEGLRSIGEDAFFGSGLTSVYIPQSVTDIAEYAFVDCDLESIIVDEGNLVYDSRNGCNAIIKTELDELVLGCGTTIIPEDVIAIGSSAFYSCNKLTSIIIPKNICIIGSQSFAYCENLSSIVVDAENPLYDSRNDCNAIINTEENTIVRGTDKTVIPEGIKAIGEDAFSGCSGLTEITIPEGVTSIGAWAFNSCLSLTQINMPKGITSIGNGAFCSTPITSITIPEGVTSIEDKTFELCVNLVSVTLPKSLTSIGNNAFSSCWALASIDIPEGVTSVGGSAFAGCDALNSVVLPEGMTSIGDYAFFMCNTLESISLPESLTSIGSSAFYDCTNLVSVAIPQGVSEIKNGTFAQCDELSSVSLPNNLTSIGAKAFWGCYEIRQLTLPENLEHIGDKAFLHCRGLQSIVLPNSVKHVGEYAFQSCQELSSLVISESLDTISNYAFSKCGKLKEVTIPHSVTYIGEGAFWDCAYLRKVAIGKNVKMMERYVFADNASMVEINSYAAIPPVIATNSYVFDGIDKNTCKLNVPTGSKTAYQTANGWSDFYLIAEDEALTSLEQLTATGESVWPANIYDLNGRLVRENAHSVEGLASGVYVISGRRVVVR